MTRWIGLGWFLEIDIVRRDVGPHCSGLGVEIWMGDLPGEPQTIDEGSRGSTIRSVDVREIQ